MTLNKKIINNTLIIELENIYIDIETIYRSGHEAGGDKVSKLYELLIQDGRRDEMEKALKDKQLRRKLMQEYGLTEKSTTTI